MSILPKIIHISDSDTYGGAARAAYRLHCSLRCISVDSSMLVRVKAGDDEKVQIPNQSIALRLLNNVKKRIANRRWSGFSSPDQFFHSTANFSSGMLDSLHQLPCDLVNLHWLGSDTLTIEEISRINKPIVWTLHDMWAFCGAEHHTPDSPDARFRVGYFRDNRTDGETGPDLNRWAWERKCKAWKNPMTIVCPSRWLADCARGSSLFREWPVYCIPNPLDVQRWRPFPKSHAREFLGLPAKGHILLYGADGGELNPFKGGDLLRQALCVLHQRGVRDINLVVFGRSAPKIPVGYPCHVTYLGKLHDDFSLVAAYSAADVMIAPSRQENLPQTAVEAHACGTSVVAFRIGGLPDIVEHQVTGYLSRPFEIPDLADGIAWVLQDEQRRIALGKAARISAVRKFAEPVIAKAYSELYEQILTANY